MTATAQQAPQSADTRTTDHPVADSRSERILLSKAQVATRLGCSERSLERLVKQGRFPAPRRYGRAVVWFESAVEHVLGLAEQEQLQWHPAATGPVGASNLTSTRPTEAPAPCPIPEAHELEPKVLSHAVRKPRKAASNTTRREPTGATASDLEALQQVFKLPTV